jgi:TonB family protein
MNRSTITRKLAQIVCLALVFVFGSRIVFSQDADRKILKRIEPEYPPILRDKGIGGVVKLRVFIRPDGTVKEVQAIGGHAVLVEAGTRAVRQWRFSAADKEGSVEVTFHFGRGNN